MRRVLKWVNYDATEHVEAWFGKRRDDIVLFFVLFIVNVFVYAQRLFFYMLPSDDYMRFWGDHNTKMLITNSARWAQALLNDYVFVEKLQILPYLHTLAGIFSFTLMGFLTAHYWKRTRTIEVVAITLLISATPMFAHNLLFSTNITAWVTMLLGQIGFLAAHRKGWFWKIVGFVFLVIAIANYQTIVQVLALMVMIRIVLELPFAKTFKEARIWFGYGVVSMGYVALAYVSAWGINEWILAHYQWHATHRLAKAEEGAWETLWYRLKHVYDTPFPFNFFGKTLHVLYGFLGVLGAASAFAFYLVRQRRHVGLTLLSILWVTAVCAAIPVVVKLPELLGVAIPLRAHFPLGWAGAGALSLVFAFGKPIVRTLAVVSTVMLVIVHVYYITLFFDAAHRQTDADIARARAIVERIRNHPEYQKEPVAFYIAGQKSFGVRGWRLKWQQPFDSYWAKYAIFAHFTDLKFRQMTPHELHRFTEHMIAKQELVHPYPGKRSVEVYRNMAVLFLDADKINILIKKERELSEIPLHREPDVRNVFDIYLENGKLFYRKAPCSATDVSHKFFLRIYPKYPEKTLINGQYGGHLTWDFTFDLRGKRVGNVCTAVVELPRKFEVGKIRTGQFTRSGIDWEENLTLP